ncbi:hypothetical protein BG74_00945 [Sodalis-like endosymbiont of Proechinophthirus fluctus]|nr:hypothetical protein BG74_00945 [Sodalis-like endosymbiont of Proechinophthirus fluctus]
MLNSVLIQFQAGKIHYVLGENRADKSSLEKLLVSYIRLMMALSGMAIYRSPLAVPVKPATLWW